MERFLKKTKPSPSCQNDYLTTELTTLVPLSKQSKNMLEAYTQFMDCTLSSNNAINSVDIRRLHLSSWRFIEEDPGESLSDCDKDDEENLEEEGCAKAEDDEDSEDGFIVLDGYLSENEGMEHDRNPMMLMRSRAHLALSKIWRAKSFVVCLSSKSISTTCLQHGRACT
ncbi:Chromatin assembly factor 1 subunit FAS1, partial [Cucurbita argyrosperma subsp. sororia]